MVLLRLGYYRYSRVPGCLWEETAARASQASSRSVGFFFLFFLFLFFIIIIFFSVFFAMLTLPGSQPAFAHSTQYKNKL
jgi:hypothetical protein